MFKSRMKQFTSSKVFHILRVLNILHVLQVLQSYKCSLDCFLAILCRSSPEAALGVSQKVSTTPFELRSRLPRFLTTKSPPPTVSSSIFVSEEMWIFRAAFPESILIIFFKFHLLEDCDSDPYIKIIFNFGQSNYNEIIRK